MDRIEKEANKEILKRLLYAFKFETELDAVCDQVDGKEGELSYLELLERLLDVWDINSSKKDKIQSEIKNSFFNMELALRWEHENVNFVKERIKVILLRDKDLKDQEQALMFSEQIPLKGHPIHVCTKTKLGFTKEDVKKYCPEFCSPVSIPLVGVNNNYVENQGDTTIWTNYIRTHLSESSNIEEEYFYFPIHPWQLENVIKKEMATEISDKLIKPTKHKINAFPSLSFRTLSLPMSQSNDLGYHVKLPVGVQATSVFRLLTKRDLYNGIIYSKLINDISDNLSSISEGKGKIVNELLGCHCTLQKESLRPMLSFMLRESPLKYIDNQGTLVVASSLVHTSDVVRKPLISYFINNSKETVENYFNSLISILLSMPIELFLKYGISLDPHGQNCIFSLDKKFNVNSLLYRDLGSIQIVENYPLAGGDFSVYDKKSTFLPYKDTLNEFVHALYLNLIGNLINTISNYYGIPQKTLWGIVKNNTLEIIDKTNVSHRKKQEFLKFVFSDKLPLKSLMMMRLGSGTLFTYVRNPML